MRVSIHTFGCRLNQSESESIGAAYAAAGHEVRDAAHEADLHIVNSCTVTGAAEQKLRRLVRALLRSSPGARIVVTGCYAEMEAASIRALGEGVEVVEGSRKSELLSMATPPSAAIPPPDPFAFLPALKGFRSRAALKVQDGCDNRCAYCRVWMARGRAQSLEPARALDRLRLLEESGYAEAVLTGVNLSQYRSEGLDFPGLAQYLLAGTERIRIRLSSYEPDRIDEAFLALATQPRVRPFFHLAVQSLDDGVLAAMGRRYRAANVFEAVGALRSAREDPFISCDLIAGFPGEGEGQFATTLARAEEARFSYMHIFAFSPRPGTRAATMLPRPPASIVKERVAQLSRLSIRLRSDYAAGWEGKYLEAVAEEGGRILTAENFLKIDTGGIALRPGETVSCRFSAGSGRDRLGGCDGIALSVTCSNNPFPCK